ncbi:hypothetical protein GCM10023185_07410 [Hymenobacter saemangeumensis]|uniref:HTH cro/C1-type domain-containing protein n=1 Tax=Hymenobacter saemangeumensis TaxID=1084522 RepID=A0ABP8I2S0_9BACT
MDKEAVARNLLLQRQQRGLTQEQLAERAGVTTRTIQRIEAGSGAPHLSTLSLLAGALELPVQDLMKNPELLADGPKATVAGSNLMLLHLLPLLGLLLPFANVLAPLFYWLYKRTDNRCYDAHAPAVVNFQATMTFGIGVAVVLLVLYFPVGLLLLGLCYGLIVGFSIRNARRAWRGQPACYPLSLPLLKGR